MASPDPHLHRRFSHSNRSIRSANASIFGLSIGASEFENGDTYRSYCVVSCYDEILSSF